MGLHLDRFKIFGTLIGKFNNKRSGLEKVAIAAANIPNASVANYHPLSQTSNQSFNFDHTDPSSQVTVPISTLHVETSLTSSDNHISNSDSATGPLNGGQLAAGTIVMDCAQHDGAATSDQIDAAYIQSKGNTAYVNDTTLLDQAQLNLEPSRISASALRLLRLPKLPSRSRAISDDASPSQLQSQLQYQSQSQSQSPRAAASSDSIYSTVSLTTSGRRHDVINLDYLLNEVMSTIQPLDWPTFLNNEQRQPLRIVASSVRDMRTVLLSRDQGSYSNLPSLLSCIRASMVI